MNANPRKLWSRLSPNLRRELVGAFIGGGGVLLFWWMLGQQDWRIHENRLPASERTEEAGGTLAPGQKFN